MKELSRLGYSNECAKQIFLIFFKISFNVCFRKPPKYKVLIISKFHADFSNIKILLYNTFMFLDSLILKQFRVFKEQQYTVGSPVVGIYGPNTAGKTSILEAIYILSRGKSSRSRVDSDVIKKGYEFASAQLKFRNKEDEKELYFVVQSAENTRSAKVFKINGVTKSIRNFTGTLACVLFSPDDIRLILGSPSRRRDYLDTIFFQFDKEYKKDLGVYTRSLKQCNAVLQLILENRATKSDLDVWVESLVVSGKKITEKRINFFKDIDSFIAKTSHELSDGWEMKIDYIPNRIDKDRIERNYHYILNSGHILGGPHRDDYDFKIKLNGDDRYESLADFGSRGQQRIGALIFKLSELEYIADAIKARPILLLDDVFSELDEVRREKVLNYSKNQQTIITTTDKKNLENIDGIQLISLK